MQLFSNIPIFYKYNTSFLNMSGPLWKKIGINNNKPNFYTQKSINIIQQPYKNQSFSNSEEFDRYTQSSKLLQNKNKKELTTTKMEGKTQDLLFQTFLQQYKQLDNLKQDQNMKNNICSKKQQQIKTFSNQSNWTIDGIAQIAQSKVMKQENFQNQNKQLGNFQQKNQFTPNFNYSLRSIQGCGLAQLKDIISQMFLVFRNNLLDLKNIITHQKNNFEQSLNRVIPQIFDFIDMNKILNMKTYQNTQIQTGKILINEIILENEEQGNSYDNLLPLLRQSQIGCSTASNNKNLIGLYEAKCEQLNILKKRIEEVVNQKIQIQRQNKSLRNQNDEIQKQKKRQIEKIRGLLIQNESKIRRENKVNEQLQMRYNEINNVIQQQKRILEERWRKRYDQLKQGLQNQLKKSTIQLCNYKKILNQYQKQINSLESQLKNTKKQTISLQKYHNLSSKIEKISFLHQQKIHQLLLQTQNLQQQNQILKTQIQTYSKQLQSYKQKLSSTKIKQNQYYINKKQFQSKINQILQNQRQQMSQIYSLLKNQLRNFKQMYKQQNQKNILLQNKLHQAEFYFKYSYQNQLSNQDTCRSATNTNSYHQKYKQKYSQTNSSQTPFHQYTNKFNNFLKKQHLTNQNNKTIPEKSKIQKTQNFIKSPKNSYQSLFNQDSPTNHYKLYKSSITVQSKLSQISKKRGINISQTAMPSYENKSRKVDKQKINNQQIMNEQKNKKQQIKIKLQNQEINNNIKIGNRLNLLQKRQIRNQNKGVQLYKGNLSDRSTQSFNFNRLQNELLNLTSNLKKQLSLLIEK